MQTSATHTKVGRDLLIADTGLTERANLFDVFLPELGRLTSASLAAGPRVLARHALRNDYVANNEVKDIRDKSLAMAVYGFRAKE